MSSSASRAPGQNAGPSLRANVEGLPDYVAGRRATDAKVAALASNESHEAPLPSVERVVRESISRINRYPDMAASALRERLALFLNVSPEEVVVGPGSVGVLQQIMAAMCGPGDEVIFAWRSFEAYPILVTLTGATPVPVPLDHDEYHDLDAMLAAINDRTRVVIICTPNNPTGTTVGQSQLERFVAKVPEHVLVVIDEAYVEYVGSQGIDSLEIFRTHANVCVLRTFSKAYGLAGLRVGYAAAHEALAQGLRRVALPFGVTALAQAAAIASLDATEEIQARAAAVIEERSRVIRHLRSAGWNLPDSNANFIWLGADGELKKKLVDAFDHADILVRGYADDGVRVTLADATTNDRVLEVLGNRATFDKR